MKAVSHETVRARVVRRVVDDVFHGCPLPEMGENGRALGGHFLRIA
jgi:hypothetical protein